MNINVKDEYNKTNIHDILKLLDEELVGLKPVKKRIKEISSLLLVDIMRTKLGLLAGFSSQQSLINEATSSGQ